MRDNISRRNALKAVSGAMLLPAACSTIPETLLSSTKFAHGIASGDPDQTSVVIWTRISEVSGPVDVEWQVASDAAFNNIVKRGRIKTDTSRDYTVKVVVEGLRPGLEYFYKFSSNGTHSHIGQTRTLPDGCPDQLVLAIATCSNYPFGYFNAYDSIAKDSSIDLVVHLGDYIYEYSVDGYGGESGKKLGRKHYPAHEILSLDDYRKRHAQYKTDEGSLAMHARHPLIVIWDDHETANNPWMEGAQNHQHDEGDWLARRAVSMQAYYEWLPIRDPVNASDRPNYWRHYKFGDLVSLITLESRHTGRSKQIDYADHESELDTVDKAGEFLKNVIGAPQRTFLSNEMEKFLQVELEESSRSGRIWRIIGNQSIMAKSVPPVLNEALFDKLRKELEGNGKQMLEGLDRLAELGLPGDLDAWDGYPEARERFYQIAKNAGVHDLLVVSGDSHGFWANALFDADERSMGLELGATGISSPRSLLAFGEAGLKRFDELNSEQNKEIVWCDGRHRGFIRMEINRKGVQADFVAVSDVESLRYFVSTIHSVNIVNREGKLQYESNNDQV